MGKERARSEGEGGREAREETVRGDEGITLFSHYRFFFLQVNRSFARSLNFHKKTETQ